MRRTPIAVCLPLATLLCSVALQAQNVASAPNSLTAAERKAGWTLLFDGATMHGWRGYRMDTVPSGWRVVDGAITTVGHGADLITTTQYDNAFELEVDWKMNRGGNSGIFFAVVEDTSLHAIYESGPEFQLLDNESYADVTTAKTMTGANYALHEPVKDMRRPLGEWNHARLVVRGSHVEHWLNGVKLLEYELGSDDWKQRVASSKFADMPFYGRAKRGYIGLQNHDETVAFRNIRIRKLNQAGNER